MDRYDWMKILSRGCPPPRQKKTVKNVPTIEVKTEEKVEESPIDDEKVFDSENPNPEATINEADSKKFKGKTKEKLSKILQEEINHFRNMKSISVYGADILPPIKTFDELEKYDVKKRIVENLLKENYKEPTPIQMQAWSLLLKKREVLGCAPTGSGKTAAFLLPIIHHLKGPHTKGFRALIITPTRELARQIVREGDRLAEGTDLKIGCIKKSKLTTTTTSFFKKLDILVSPPQKLVFLLNENAKMQALFERLEWLIIDESDKLFEGGKCNFRDQLASIIKAASGPNVIRAMFSATLSYEVEEWSKLNLNNVAIVTAGVRNTLPDVDQSLSFCASNAGKVMAIYDILREGYEIPCLIFVQTKERAKQLCNEIILTGRPVRCIHSDMSQTRRDEVVLEFRQKQIWILICTELMGRGIDFKGVNLVINYDFPPSIVSYIHRTGRTGRAGRKGRAITFWSLEDRPLLRSVGHIIKNSGGEVEDWILNLKNSTKLDRKNFERNLPDRGAIKDGMTTTPMISSFTRKRKKNWNKGAHRGRSKYAKKSTNSSPSDINIAAKKKKPRDESKGKDLGKKNLNAVTKKTKRRIEKAGDKSKYAKKLAKNSLASDRNVKIKKKK